MNETLQHSTRAKDQYYRTAADILTLHRDWNEIHSLVMKVQTLGGRGLVFAGAIRDALYSTVNCVEKQPRDFDLGVEGLDPMVFEGLQRAMHATPNRYGGFRFKLSSGIEADVWRFEETTGIVQCRCAPTLDNILRTFVLDLNAIAFDPLKRTFYDLGALNSILRSEIGFVYEARLHDNSNFAIRAVNLQTRFGMNLSPELREFSDRWFDQGEANRYVNKNTSHSTSSSAVTPAVAAGDAESEPRAICAA